MKRPPGQRCPCRFQLRVQADQLQLNIADFSIFDVRVEDGAKVGHHNPALIAQELQCFFQTI